MMAFKCGSCGGIYTDINTHMYTVHMQRPRPFRVGDRVRVVVPEHESEIVREKGLPLEWDAVVTEDMYEIPGHNRVTLPKSPLAADHGWVMTSWLTHIDEPEIAAPRAPDRACRWCHGTGAVQLVFSSAPCECVS